MLDRTQAPPFQALPAFTLPPTLTISLPNGGELIGISGVQQEVVKIDWVFAAGRWQETVPGSSHFVSLLLDKGTTRQSAAALAATLEGMGAHLEISAGADLLYVSLYALTKNWQAALAVVNEVLRDAQFPQDELDLQKQITLENIRVNQEKTSYLAGQAIRALLFGNSHPYGAALEAEHVTALQRTHLRDFHQQFFQLVAMFATVPQPAQLNEIAQQVAPWPRWKSENAALHTAQPGALYQHVQKDGSVQSSIRLGKRTVGRDHPDYPALLLVNHILGGFFGSRLMKNIREKKGLTYGIHSSLQPYLQDGMWLISADINTANRDLAFAEIESEMNRLREEPVSLSELHVCRNHFLGSLVADVATPFSVMEKVRSTYLHCLPADYYQNLFAAIQSIEPRQLQEVAARHLAGSWHRVSAG
jgi:predicted Zn-dependent peptidase